MLARQFSPTLERLAGAFPIVAVTGPRQSGKIILVQAVSADRPCGSLEDPALLATRR